MHGHNLFTNQDMTKSFAVSVSPNATRATERRVKTSGLYVVEDPFFHNPFLYCLFTNWVPSGEKDVMKKKLE